MQIAGLVAFLTLRKHKFGKFSPSPSYSWAWSPRQWLVSWVVQLSPSCTGHPVCPWTPCTLCSGAADRLCWPRVWVSQESWLRCEASVSRYPMNFYRQCKCDGAINIWRLRWVTVVISTSVRWCKLYCLL